MSERSDLFVICLLMCVSCVWTHADLPDIPYGDPLNEQDLESKFFYKAKVFVGTALHLTVMERVPKEADSRDSNSYRSRYRRAVPANYTKTWGDNIPYVLHSSFRALDKRKREVLKTAMQFISDNLCVTFVEETYRYRQGSTSWLPQSKYPDGNFILIKHSGTVCRASIDLENRPGQQTVEPCDDFKVNVHEMLHMLRGNHMHQGSQRDNYITINRDNIDPSLKTTYARVDRTSQNYFDPLSPLMYGKYTWSANHLETWSPIRDDLMETDATISKAPVEFEELNNMYKCGERFCPKRDCGIGYLARVKGACTCVCPREYDPVYNCTFHIDGPTHNVSWPLAPFSIFAAGPVTKKCPHGFQDARTLKFKTFWGAQDFQMMRTPEQYEMPWPWAHIPICTRSQVSKMDWNSWPEGGDFCVIKPRRSYCRGDFSEYTLWIRGQARPPYTGDIGDFRFSGSDLTIKLCCRSGVTWGWPLTLPNSEPFRLVSGGTCPVIEGMREYQTILLLSSRIIPRKWGHGAKPWVNIFSDQLQIRQCYYKPPKYGCNMEITLDKVESSITLTTPGYFSVREPNRRCFYNFLVPEGARIKVTFNNVDMEAEDKMYIRRFHKWQQPHPIDRKLYPYQLMSESSYFAMEWWSSFVTRDVKQKGVNFTASVVLAKDSCYNLTTRGSDYAGDHTYTETFEECLPWDQTTGCTDFPSESSDTFWLLSAGNKCRNPDGHLRQPWCYTFKNGTNCHKRYCDVCNHLEAVDVIKNCSDMISAQPDFCASSISRLGCFKSCKMTQPVYKPVTCGSPPLPADGQLVGSPTLVSYKQGDHAFIKCLNPRDPMVNSIKCTDNGWTKLSHACSASYDKPCPDGWTHHGARCFRYFTNWTTRRLAESNCAAQADSGTLFQVRDVADQVMMRRHRFRYGERGNYSHGMWISGELSPLDKRWYYTGTGEEMKYFNWTHGTVTDEMTRNCVKMTAEYSWEQDAGAWKTLRCDDSSVVAPYVCQTAIQGAEISDRSELCQNILARSPYFCNSTGTRYVSHQYCGRSCDRDNGTLCQDSQINGYTKTSSSFSVGSGEVVTFACPKGHHLTRGDLVRACGVNGTLLGEEPVCSATPSNMTMMVKSLRKRPQAIKAHCIYILDTDAYRIAIKGRITRWFYVCNQDGELHISVFKPNGRSRYQYVGSNSFVCQAGYKQEYIVPSANQIAADVDDVIAVWSPKQHTLSVNACDDAQYEVMVNPYAWARDVTLLKQASVFANTTCMVPSLGYSIEQ